MRPDAHRREAVGIAGLKDAMEGSLGLQAACGPTSSRAHSTAQMLGALTYPTPGSAKGRSISTQVAGLRHMVGIQSAPRCRSRDIPSGRRRRQGCLPCSVSRRGQVLRLVVFTPLAGRDADAMTVAPRDRLRRGILVGQPGVMRIILRQHRLECAAHDGERLGGSLGHDHRHAPLPRLGVGRDGTDGAHEEEDEVGLEHCQPDEDRRDNANSAARRHVVGPQPPLPEKHKRRRPATAPAADTCAAFAGDDPFEQRMPIVR